MDEPFTGLDPVNTKVLKDVILDLKRQGKSILFSTHQMEQVERMCDSILLINHGKSVLEGNLKEVKSRFGRNTVQIEYEGDAGFLQQNGLVQSVQHEGPYVFVRLAPGADPQKLLHAAAEGARLSKFELMEPSLEEIFIDVVGKSNA
jgi:ABC-2 type transport system ATP-binding protein